MAGVAVSPASLLGLIAEIIDIPANTGVFKKDCADLARRVCLLTHLVEEIRDSPTPKSDPSSSLSPSENDDWWSDLVVGLQSAKRLLYAATSFRPRESSDKAAKKISFHFQCVAWKLEKALSGLRYDRYHISVEVREQVELARSQLKRATQRYGSLNSKRFSIGFSEPIEKDDVSTNTNSKVVTEEKLESIQETEHSNIPEKKFESPRRRKSSSVSLAFFLSKEADDERSEKAVITINDNDSTKNLEEEELTIPEDFLCPISLELMRDPAIVSTGQTYERSYIQRWIDCGNLTCPKTQQRLENFTLTPNYVLRSLISQWCTKHNIEQPGGYKKGKTKNIDGSLRDLTGDMSAIRAVVRKLSTTRSIQVLKTALSELRSLSKRSTDNRILIAEAGAIPVLIKLLTSEDIETQEKAVTCVLNLSIYDPNKERIMLAGPAVTSIVHVLRAGTMIAKENAAATLFSLSFVDESKIVIGATGAIPALVHLLENGSVRGKKDAATALFNLCLYQGNTGRAVRAGIVNPLLKMLTERIVDEALTVLSFLASCNQDAKALMLKANAILPLVDILQKDLQPRNRENAAALLLWLCKNDTERLTFIGRLGAVVPLMELSRDGTERAKRKANSLLELLRKLSH
uniref:RING-type E3 ubiquitin transferase n=1 Tax=Noccaea caerulescens TaxID=107243 RepID=A0A1J3IKF1_NOCCA